MKIDVIVPLTGRSQSGKDALAKIAVKDFNCTAALALSDWFKKILSEEFKLPIETFYSDDKDKEFRKPIIVSMGNLRRLKRAWGDKAGLGAYTDRVAVSKWKGRLIKSPRQLMQWWAHEVVNKTIGPTFHCKVLEEDYLSKLEREKEINVIFITDARNYQQSNYFKEKYPNVYPIKVFRSDPEEGEHASETEVDGFPKGYFYKEVDNSGSLNDLKVQVEELLGNIMTDVKARYTIQKPEKIAKKGTRKKRSKKQ